MENFFLVIFSFIVLIVILAFARVVFTYLLDIVAHGILPFLIVRFITFTMEHWMGSTIAWTLSIGAGIFWGVYPRLRQWINDPHGTIQDVREREERIARERAEFNRKYSQHGSNTGNTDYVKEEVERCDTDKYE